MKGDSEEKAAAYRRHQKAGSEFSRQAYEIDREHIGNRQKLLEAHLGLFKQTQLDREATWQRVNYHRSDPDPFAKSIGDFATSAAEALVETIRDYDCNPQTVWQALGDKLPDVKFSTDWHDAATLIAATLREYRQLGLVEGLELAAKSDAMNSGSAGDVRATEAAATAELQDEKLKLFMFGYYEIRFLLDADDWEREAKKYIAKGRTNSTVSIIEYINGAYENWIDDEFVGYYFMRLSEVEIQRFVSDLNNIGSMLGYSVTYKKVGNPDDLDGLEGAKYVCELLFGRTR